LQILASNSGGKYQTISNDDSDIEQLLAVTEQLFPDATRELDRAFDLWDDQGYWLAILLIPALILSFRRGALVMLLVAPILLSSKPLQALEWHDLWQNANQQGVTALEAGDPAAAQALFKDPQWRGSAAYKSGDYKQAVDDFSGADNADGHYNRGNALAKAADLDGAIEAYDHALKLQPDMADAQANRDLVEQLKQQQEKQNSDEQNNEDNQDKNQPQDESDRQEQKPSNQESEQQDEQNGDPQQEPNKDQKPSDAEQESEQQKQKNAQEQKKKEQKEKEQQAQETEEKQAPEEPTDAEKQEQQEIEQMLRRVPDDPGGLLRAKFRYQSRQRTLQQRRPKPPTDEERW
jgi:Ca-activated chloride channel family protein